MSSRKKYLILEGRSGLANGITLLPADHPQLKLMLDEPDTIIVKSFEADSWNEANQIQHEFYGWEAYKPIEG